MLLQRFGGEFKQGDSITSTNFLMDPERIRKITVMSIQEVLPFNAHFDFKKPTKKPRSAPSI
jgi:hypothetical protein